MSLAGFVHLTLPTLYQAHLSDMGHSGKAIVFRSGSLISTLMGLLGFGLIADRWGVRKAFSAGAAMTAVSIIMLTLIPIRLNPPASIYLLWLARCGPELLIPLVALECHGLAGFGAIYGVLSLVGTIGENIGIAGVLAIGFSHGSSGHIYNFIFGNRFSWGLLVIPTLLSAYCILKTKPLQLSRSETIGTERCTETDYPQS